MRLSFILPVFNEEKHLGGVLRSIREQAASWPHEIIAVDNGSRDASPRIAEENGALCLRRPDLSIAGLRNFGAAQARGEVLVFLDSDVYLGSGWGRCVERALALLEKDGMAVTGSLCRVGRNPSWLERAWFAPISRRKHPRHLGAAHLLVRKSFFLELGGFPELETGEDYEFCRRVREAGGRIVNDLDLEAVHEGYPRTLRAFFRRERWHGRGDAKSLATVLKSRPALVGLAQTSGPAAALAAAWLARTPWPPALWAAAMLPVWLLSAYRHGGSFKGLWSVAPLYPVYFAARGVALWDAALGRKSRRRTQYFR